MFVRVAVLEGMLTLLIASSVSALSAAQSHEMMDQLRQLGRAHKGELAPYIEVEVFELLERVEALARNIRSRHGG